MSTIWRFSHVPQVTSLFFQEREAEFFCHDVCPFCDSRFQALYSQKIRELPQSGGRERLRKQVEVCWGCGWWRATRKESRWTHATAEHEFYQGWGSIMELDLPDVKMPFDDIRASVSATMSSGAQVSSREMEVTTIDIFRYVGYQPVASAMCPEPGAFMVLEDGTHTIGVGIQALQGRVALDLFSAIAAPCITSDGSVEGVIVIPGSEDDGSWHHRLNLIEAATFVQDLGTRTGPIPSQFEEFENDVCCLSSLPLRVQHLQI